MVWQADIWKSNFGDDYTARNPQTVEAMDVAFSAERGVVRSTITETFLSGLKPHNALEVGCNAGVVLQTLERMGLRRLYGIDVNEQAIKIAKENTIDQDIHIIYGTALDIPFKDNLFELVFTNGLLIHIHPNDMDRVMGEIYRCSSRYIWGYEYYSDTLEEVTYRGEDGLLWKADFTKLFTDKFEDLKLVKQEIIRHVKQPELMDVMYLFEKP